MTQEKIRKLIRLKEKKEKGKELTEKEEQELKGIKNIDPEDYEIYKENMTAREKGYDEEGIKKLYLAICEQAVADYKANQRKINDPTKRLTDRKSAKIIVKECEEFFGSEFFLNVSGAHSKDQVLEGIKHINQETEDKMNRFKTDKRK